MIEPTEETKAAEQAKKAALAALRRVADGITGAERQLDELRQDRDRKILKAVNAGASNVEAGSAADVTEGYVRKVRKR